MADKSKRLKARLPRGLADRGPADIAATRQMTDAIRAASDAPGLYTFWDYQAGAWQKNWGIRIDHLLLSPRAADRLSAAGIDKHVRNWEKPSDHVPVWIDLAVEAN